MKKILFSGLLLLLYSCNNSESSKKLTVDEVYNQFINCKDTTAEKHGCKGYVAMLIEASYGIFDFNSENGYMDYDKIADVITQSDSWTNLGYANNQGVLQKSLDYVVDGKAVLVFNAKKPTHGVALIVGGNMEHSTSWDLDVPLCIFFNMKNPEKSVMKKSLAFAFTHPKKLMVFVKD